MMLLDEPTAGMTHEDVERISALIKRVAANRTVLMVERNLSVVENLSDRVTVLSRGEVLAEGADRLAQPRRDPGLHGVGHVSALLTVRGLEAWYDESHILHGVDLDVPVGRGDAPRPQRGRETTTLKAIMGIVRKRRGSVRFGEAELINRPSNAIARLGLAFCPEERGIFASLNVDENLRLPPVVAPGGLDSGTILELFPNLRERLRSQGTKLSGGEQQMLAIARILRAGARLLLLDEPTEGLAPVIVQQIGATIRRLKARRLPRFSWWSKSSDSPPPWPTATT